MELMRFVHDHGPELSIMLGTMRLAIDVGRGLRACWKRLRSPVEEVPDGGGDLLAPEGTGSRP
ncbi:hypothetical protein ACFYQQ_34505 [Streptomyces sp. NPDC005496]|uniref:hypothetical protein n=1 Tax=unclassified Streptomyces TaxID=2593676 RepID=UPI0033B0569F